MTKDYSEAEVNQIAVSVSELHSLAKARIPRIAEVFAEANLDVSKAGATEDQDFLHENGNTSILKASFSTARKAFVDILYENNKNLYGVTEILEKIIKDYRENDDMNADDLNQFNKDLDNRIKGVEKDAEKREDDGKLAPNAPPDHKHTPVESGDESKPDRRRNAWDPAPGK